MDVAAPCVYMYACWGIFTYINRPSTNQPTDRLNQPITPTSHHSDTADWGWTTPAIAMLVVSSIVGTLIGYTGWSCRSLVSATTFTLVGVVNKFLTILLNVFIWDKHASPLGIAALVFCLLGGSCYKQAPMRSGAAHERSSPTAAGYEAVNKHAIADSEEGKAGVGVGIEAVPLMGGKHAYGMGERSAAAGTI